MIAPIMPDWAGAIYIALMITLYSWGVHYLLLDEGRKNMKEKIIEGLMWAAAFILIWCLCMFFVI